MSSEPFLEGPGHSLNKRQFYRLYLDLQDLCIEEVEGQELEELWTSTCVFITLFLLSVSYGATVTILKVKWVFSTPMQDTPQTFQEYVNILQTRA
ncbi:Immunoglobulin heavy constant epsilon [Apodemus speciosus]